ncbi:MAG: OadG family transporter subunit [Pseudomonadales bacterium]|jgi:oxaloacetate decarboxylase gamma subunit|nr:OadG family transporter subunit [Pseudomonadales bacterium]MDG1442176.1 OadG family transporter subunit [Pseudomonadales bacterium]
MSDVLTQAIDLVVYGMGTVVVFLTVLVGATMLMSYVLQTFFTTESPEVTLRPSAAASEGLTDPKILAALSAAVKKYREDHN